MMKMAGEKLKNELYEHGVYDAYQFVENTRKTIMTAEFCKDTIAALIGGM